MSFDHFKKRFPLVAPSWVVKQIERNKLPPETLLDLTKMAEICSMEDLAILLCLNTELVYVEQVFGFGAAVNLGLLEHWCKYHNATYMKVVEVTALYKDTAMQRLLSNPAIATPTQAPTVSRLNANQADIEAILITLQPGSIGGPDQDTVQRNVVNAYMRQLYVFTDYATLAQDALFVRYLKNVTLDDVSEPA